MYEILTLEDEIRVPPKNFGLEANESIKKSLAERYENRIINNASVVLAITEILEFGEGQIEVEDAGIYYKVKFKAMAYSPRLHEVIEGEVVDITNFGIFVRFGPLDGLCHISQIINDFISFDKKSVTLACRDSHKIVKVGDIVRVRIIALSLEKKEVNKINLTMRQPGLGKLEWLEEEKEKKEKEAHLKTKQ